MVSDGRPPRRDFRGGLLVFGPLPDDGARGDPVVVRRPLRAYVLRMKVRECHEDLFEEALARRVISVFGVVNSKVAHPLPLTAYIEALRSELASRGLQVARGERFTATADLVIERRLIVHARAGAATTGRGRRLLLHCLEATGMATGLLLCFGESPSAVLVTALAEAPSAPRWSRANRVRSIVHGPAAAARRSGRMLPERGAPRSAAARRHGHDAARDPRPGVP